MRRIDHLGPRRQPVGRQAAEIPEVIGLAGRLEMLQIDAAAAPVNVALRRIEEILLRLVHHAVQAGGVAMLKAWAGPFFDVKFCPTGGLTLQNAPDFLALGNVVCVGGSWLVPANVPESGDWGRVTRLAMETQVLRK